MIISSRDFSLLAILAYVGRATSVGSYCTLAALIIRLVIILVLTLSVYVFLLPHMPI